MTDGDVTFKATVGPFTGDAQALAEQVKETTDVVNGSDDLHVTGDPVAVTTDAGVDGVLIRYYSTGSDGVLGAFVVDDQGVTVEATGAGALSQTGDHNTAPLQRLTHRAKTHLGYTVLQTGPAAWIWGTPHGLYRLVDHRGTHHLTQTEFVSLRDHALIDASEYDPTG